MKTIVLTGAAGNLGSKLRAAWVGRYALRLIDKETHGDPEIAPFDLSVWSETWADLLVGAQAVLHLAANSRADASVPGVLRGPSAGTACAASCESNRTGQIACPRIWKRWVKIRKMIAGLEWRRIDFVVKTWRNR